MIHPELLRTFLVLAQTKHFTRAAEQLHMTQPGVSQHLKRLETYFGAALIQKQGRSFVLTEPGKRVLAYGRRLLEEHREFLETVVNDDPHVGRCRFASPGSFGLRVFDVLLESARKHRGLRVEVIVAPNASIVSHLREERVDVGFMSEAPKGAPVDYELFAKERLLLALPKGRRAKSLAQLAELTYVNHPDGFTYAEKLLGANFGREFRGMESFPVSVFINQINRILDPVADGLGFTILPETACRRYSRRDAIQLVSLPKAIEEPIYRVVRRGEKLPSRYAPLLERMRR